MDAHKKELYKYIGHTYRFDCPCCNWTKHGDKRKNYRIVGKSVRRRLNRMVEDI